MASALIIEEEAGTTRASRHPHNGYYAGDFGIRPVLPTPAATVPSVPLVPSFIETGRAA